MNQCVPSWDLYENSGMIGVENEVAELTWKNGQLAMHGLGAGRVGTKAGLASSAGNWEKPLAGGTLEAVVNQAARLPHQKYFGGGEELAPWFDHRRAMSGHAAAASLTMTMDALVPCSNARANRSDTRVPSVPAPESGTGVVGCSTRVGSCSGGAATMAGGRAAGADYNSCDTNGSASESATCGRDSRQLTADSGEKELLAAGFTSPSMGSPDNTSSGNDFTKSIGDDRDSIYHSRRPREKFDGDGGIKRGTGKSSILTKRSRAAAIHNQSERKRRDRINQRMKTLQRLVPNSSKTDKASMLDEVIEYVKQLQAQVQMMRMSMSSSMMLPLAAMQQQQQLQMSMMAPMAMGMGIMDMSAMALSAPPPAAFMPPWDCPGERLPMPSSPLLADPLSAYLAWQSQLMTMDAYSRLAALYQQFQQPPNPGSKNQ